MTTTPCSTCHRLQLVLPLLAVAEAGARLIVAATVWTASHSATPMSRRTVLTATMSCTATVAAGPVSAATHCLLTAKIPTTTTTLRRQLLQR